MLKPFAAAAIAAALLSSTSAYAQSTALDKLSNFKSTGAKTIPQIPQGGAAADAIKNTLKKIKVPDGFKIDLYAIVPDARDIAVGPQGVVTFISTRKDKVYSVTDRKRTHVADDVREFAPSLEKTIPHGVCFSKDGFLFIAEQNRVLVYPAAEYFYEGGDVVAVPVVKQGDLIPIDEESYNHTARICRVGPDNKLYISLGQPTNVFAPEKMDLYAKVGMGGIIRMDRDGKNREVFATGVRNSGGMDFNPKDKSLWFTDNQVDGMGDDIPPGELNRATKPGEHFGFPYYGGGKIRTNEYKDKEPPANVVFPQVEMTAHAADMGMIFYTGKMFPSKYQGGILSVEHGSWNRTTPSGAKVLFTTLKEDGTADKTTTFADGWIGENGEYLGRPIDVAQLPDGSVLVSDDLTGAVYRISYSKP